MSEYKEFENTGLRDAPSIAGVSNGHVAAPTIDHKGSGRDLPSGRAAESVKPAKSSAGEGSAAPGDEASPNSSGALIETGSPMGTSALVETGGPAAGDTDGMSLPHPVLAGTENPQDDSALMGASLWPIEIDSSERLDPEIAREVFASGVVPPTAVRLKIYRGLLSGAEILRDGTLPNYPPDTHSFKAIAYRVRDLWEQENGLFWQAYQQVAGFKKKQKAARDRLTEIKNEQIQRAKNLEHEMKQCQASQAQACRDLRAHSAHYSVVFDEARPDALLNSPAWKAEERRLKGHTPSLKLAVATAAVGAFNGASLGLAVRAFKIRDVGEHLPALLLFLPLGIGLAFGCSGVIQTFHASAAERVARANRGARAGRSRRGWREWIVMRLLALGVDLTVFLFDSCIQVAGVWSVLASTNNTAGVIHISPIIAFFFAAAVTILYVAPSALQGEERGRRNGERWLAANRSRGVGGDVIESSDIPQIVTDDERDIHARRTSVNLSLSQLQQARGELSNLQSTIHGSDDTAALERTLAASPTLSAELQEEGKRLRQEREALCRDVTRMINSRIPTSAMALHSA